MKISVNTELFEAVPGTTVCGLVSAQTGRELFANGQPADGGKLGIAVVRNAEVVPRSQWSSTELRAGDELEIVTAVQGG